MSSAASDRGVDGRPFCDLAHTERDVATLNHLRSAFRRAASGDRAGVLRFADEIGDHFVAVPDWGAVEAPRPVSIVGFFGQTREDVDHAAIVALEHEIVARAAAYQGLLVYHNAQLANGQWGNLVVFASPVAVTGVAGDATHQQAIAAAPRHYRSLRLHRGRLEQGMLGDAPPAIRETVYLDFEESPAWRGLRVYE